MTSIPLPQLIGTPPQIAWAERIRAEAMKKFPDDTRLPHIQYARSIIDQRRTWGIR